MGGEFEWRWADPTGQQRAVRTDELRAALASGVIAPNTPVWRNGWPEWKPAYDVPELTSSALSSANGVVPNIPPPPLFMVAVQHEFEEKAVPAARPVVREEPPPPPRYVPAATHPTVSPVLAKSRASAAPTPEPAAVTSEPPWRPRSPTPRPPPMAPRADVAPTKAADSRPKVVAAAPNIEEPDPTEVSPEPPVPTGPGNRKVNGQSKAFASAASVEPGPAPRAPTPEPPPASVATEPAERKLSGPPSLPDEEGWEETLVTSDPPVGIAQAPAEAKRAAPALSAADAERLLSGGPPLRSVATVIGVPSIDARYPAPPPIHPSSTPPRRPSPAPPPPW